MVKKFFVNWATWVKLVFILACAIVVTVLLGCMKLAYTHWRLRKYAAVEKEKREQSVQRQMSLRRRKSGSDEIPFGIRAIESGIQVEGVWISPANTPENRSRETSAASSTRKNVPGREYDIDLEKQDLNRSHDRSASGPISTTTQRGRSSFDRFVLAEKLANVEHGKHRESFINGHRHDRSKSESDSNKLQSRDRHQETTLDRKDISHEQCSERSTQRSRDSSPERAPAKPPRNRQHPPLSYIRYSGNPYILRNSSTTSTLEGLEAIHKASTSLHDHNGDGSTSSDSTGGIEPIAASAPDLLNTQLRYKQRQNSSSSDLELLNKHRLSQAAETGQLTPRGRRPSKSYSADFARESSSKRNSSDAPSRPKFDDLPAAVRRTSMPDITPFVQFCKTASPTPPLDSSMKGRAEVGNLSSKTDSQNTPDSSPLSPLIPASEGAAELKLPPPMQQSFEKQCSSIARGHGSGFEILKPGSLNPPMSKDLSAEQKKRAPPVSLHNHSGKRSTNSDDRRKLQKMRRPSVDSSSSSNTSRRSRISIF